MYVGCVCSIKSDIYYYNILRMEILIMNLVEHFSMEKWMSFVGSEIDIQYKCDKQNLYLKMCCQSFKCSCIFHIKSEN